MTTPHAHDRVFEPHAPGWQPIALQFIALPTALTFDANSTPAGFVFDPERRGAATLTADLRARGVHVSGRARAAAHPPPRSTSLRRSDRRPSSTSSAGRTATRSTSTPKC